MITQLIKELVYRINGNVTTETLIKRGLVVGENFNRMHNVLIDDSHCWLISIGDNVTLAPNVHILAHDASTKMLLGVTKIGRVDIGNNIFIGAGSIILPSSTVENDVIIGAGSVVNGRIRSGYVYAGNPIKPICSIVEYNNKHKNNMKSFPVFDESYTVAGGITSKQKEEMKALLIESIGYIT